MVPYFAYVFWFLEPQNIIDRIRRQALEHRWQRCAGDTTRKLSGVAQAQIIDALEELTDITSNSISGKDKIIASAAVDALRDMAIEYIRVKPQAAPIWFTSARDIRLNAGFRGDGPGIARATSSSGTPGSNGRCCASI